MMEVWSKRTERIELSLKSISQANKFNWNGFAIELMDKIKAACTLN